MAMKEKKVNNMAKHNSIVVFSVSFILAFVFPLLSEAVDQNPKPHIVYMGSLPQTPYSPTSHHMNMLQQVVDDINATNFIVHSYKRSFNGFAAKITDQQREKLTKMKGVVSVFPSKILHTQTTRSWDFMGFPLSIKRNQIVESDVVIGVIDTGIWPESDSFNDEGFGPVPKKWKGTCAGGKNFTCNKKIIGARFYVEDSAIDRFGHGTHTASTAAGNNVHNASFFGIAQGITRGGVPSARIAVYKVCDDKGCAAADILAAFDDAIADGVDIISISLSHSVVYELYVDATSIGSFHAMAKGILTVNSAGNSGPNPGSIGILSPWILTVAANTMDREFIDKVILGNGKILTGSSINPFMSNGTKFPIAKENSNSKNCSRESANVCKCLDSFSVKRKVILCNENYAADYVAFNNVASGVISFGDRSKEHSFITVTPSITLYPLDYATVESYTNSTRDPIAEIIKSESIEDHSSPIVANFSSRGPNTLVPEILKPDISAPGVNILAAFSPLGTPLSYKEDKMSLEFIILSGTSMSCPQVAGIAAYVKTFHLDWSPAVIKSAIMTSAIPMNSSKDQIGEFAYGSGHVNPVQAINPGLVYDIGKEDYIQMLCNLGYDNETVKSITGENNVPCSGAAHKSLVRNLNYPALATNVEAHASFDVRFNRTVTNVGLPNSNYRASISPNPQINITVAPEVLSFKSLNEKKPFVVTIIGGKIPEKTVLISSLLWSDGTYNVRSPIVVNVTTS